MQRNGRECKLKKGRSKKESKWVRESGGNEGA